MNNSEWIKVEEKLPKDEQTVLVTLKDSSKTAAGECIGPQVQVAVFVESNSDFDGLWYPHFAEYDSNDINWTDEVIAWMPFPKPYEEEGGAE